MGYSFGVLQNEDLFKHGPDYLSHFLPENVGPASYDLTCSDEVYAIDTLALPQKGETVDRLLHELGAQRYDLSQPLFPKHWYMCRVQEKLAFPSNIRGMCNPKSSTGRNDIFARIMADGVGCYDEIPLGFNGHLWLPLQAQSYPSLLSRGECLVQLRISHHDRAILSSRQALCVEDQRTPLLYDAHGRRIPLSDANVDEHGGVIVTVDFSLPISVLECKSDLKTPVDLAKKNSHPLEDYFMKAASLTTEGLILEPGKFYLLQTAERIHVPLTLACEMKPIQSKYGEFRVHYAGFVDPGWGGEKGRALVLELRPFERIRLRPGQPIGVLVYEQLHRASTISYEEREGSNYARALEGYCPRPAKQFIIPAQEVMEKSE